MPAGLLRCEIRLVLPAVRPVRPARSAARFTPASPLREEAAGSLGRNHDVVSLRRRQLRILDRIERDLADSDPGLAAHFRGLARRAGGLDLRWVEKIGSQRFWIFSRRRHERNPGPRPRDIKRPEHWNDW